MFPRFTPVFLATTSAVSVGTVTGSSRFLASFLKSFFHKKSAISTSGSLKTPPSQLPEHPCRLTFGRMFSSSPFCSLHSTLQVVSPPMPKLSAWSGENNSLHTCRQTDNQSQKITSWVIIRVEAFGKTLRAQNCCNALYIKKKNIQSII